MIRLPRFLPAVILACATACPIIRVSAADETPAPATPPGTPAPGAPAPSTPPGTPAPAAPDPAATTPAPGTPAPGGIGAPGTPAAPATPTVPPVTPNVTTPTEPAPAQPEAAKVDPALADAANDYWHYAKVGRYDLAAAAGARILGSGQSVDAVLLALETVAGERGDALEGALLQWQQNPTLQDVTSKLEGVVKEAHSRRRLSPDFIRFQIERLSTTPRGRINGMVNLKQTGEMAVPFMIDYLRDPAKRQFHAAIREALIDFGRTALNPLVACTEMTQRDESTLVTVCGILGAISYPDAAPYLVRLVNDKGTPASVRAAAQSALVRMGSGDGTKQNAGQMFQDLGERFYYGNSSISPDAREKMAYIWFWDEAKGLYKDDVPPQIYYDVMAMRAAEYTLKLDPSKADAVSLWLAADYKREVDLPDGTVDPVHKGSASAHFYGTQLGTQYLNTVLQRGLKDKNAAVALRAIKSLEEVAGQANLFGSSSQPLTESMSYPDRLVRFEAAMALASALPQKPFEGQDQVVAILGEAVAQTGKPSALVFGKDQDEFNQLVKEIGAAGYVTAGGFKAEAAVAGASQLPGVDLIIVAEDAGDTAIDQLNAQLSQSRRLARVPRVFIASSKGSPYFAQAVDNRLINATTARDAAGLTPVLLKARTRSGVLALDEKVATTYALRATDLLTRLAINRGSLSALDALATLLLALDDARIDVAKSSAGVLGYLDAKEVQPTLITKATDEKTPDDVKIASLKGLSANAKAFGNHLDAGQVDALQKLLAASQNQEVKNAAAESHGALNLPAEQAKKLIVDQARVK